MKGWQRTIAGQNRRFIDRRNAEQAAERLMRPATTDLAAYRTSRRTAAARNATQYVLVSEAAEVLGVKEATVLRYLRCHRLWGRPVGKKGYGPKSFVEVASIRALFLAGKVRRGNLAHLDQIIAGRVARLERAA